MGNEDCLSTVVLGCYALPLSKGSMLFCLQACEAFMESLSEAVLVQLQDGMGADAASQVPSCYMLAAFACSSHACIRLAQYCSNARTSAHIICLTGLSCQC